MAGMQIVTFIVFQSNGFHGPSGVERACDLALGLPGAREVARVYSRVAPARACAWAAYPDEQHARAD